LGDRIRNLPDYGDDDDADSSVNIIAQPGSTVRVSTHDDSEPPSMVRKPKWVRIVGPIVGALVTIGAVAKAIWDATH